MRYLPFALLTCLIPSLAWGSVGDSQINIPTGAASLEGYGQTHSVSGTTGLPTLTYAIEVPQGPADFQPTLTLTYNAAQGNGPFGMGWSLDVPYFERATKYGVIDYQNPPPWVLKGLGSGEELIQDGSFFLPRISSGAPLEITKIVSGFEVKTVDGLTYSFTSGDKKFRFLLSEVKDSHGNAIEYRYDPFDHKLKSIEYSDAKIEFVYEERPDVQQTRIPGFLLEEPFRVSEMIITVGESKHSHYHLKYRNSEVQPLSRISAIHRDFPHDRIPPWTFVYQEGLQTTPHEVENFPGFNPTTDGHAWVDLNGDALPDAVDGTSGYLQAKWNEGNFRFGDLEEVEGLSEQFDLDSKTRWVDLNANGVVDLLRQPTPGDADIKAYLGGENALSEGVDLDINTNISFSSKDIHVVDFNADGLSDFLQQADNEIVVWVQHKDGYFNDPEFFFADIPKISDENVFLEDINGDRLFDVVQVNKESGEIEVAFSSGLGSFEEPVLWQSLSLSPSDKILFLDFNGDGASDIAVFDSGSLRLFANNLHGFVGAREVNWDFTQDSFVLVGDFNANGTSDIVLGSPSGWVVHDFLGQKPGLMKSYSNGLGYKVDYEYMEAARNAKDWDFYPPSPTPVLSRETTWDTNKRVSETEFSFRNGFYDSSRMEFRGFEQVQRTSLADSHTNEGTVVEHYNVGREEEALGGLLERTEIFDEDRLIEAHQVDWKVRNLSPIFRLRREAAQVSVFEGNEEPVVVRTSWEYDDLENVTAEYKLGRLDVKGDEIFSASQFVDSQTVKNLPSRTTVYENGEVIKDTKFFYDDLGFGQATRGDLTRVSQWLEGDKWVNRERYGYDYRGNVVKFRNPRSGTVTTIFDEKGKYPLKEILRSEELTLEKEASWDPIFGKPLELRETNGAITKLKYDAFGRLVSIIKDGDSETYPTTSFSYHLGINPSIKTTSRGEVEMVIFEHLDALGRVKQKVVQWGDKAVLRQDNRYTKDGKIAVTGIPRVVDGIYAQPHNPVPEGSEEVSEVFYDSLGRPLTEITMEGFIREHEYSPFVEKLWSNEDLNGGSPRVFETDAHERIVSIQDDLNGDDVVFGYEWDAAGRLQNFISAEGLVTSYSYDGFDRLVSVFSEATGEYTQKFDDAGNLLERVDARGHKTTWKHDGLGHLIEAHSFGPHGEIDFNRFFINNLGLIDRVVDSAGEIRFEYDTRGRKTKATRDFGEISLSKEYLYDSQDRVIKEIFDDGTYLTREYDDRGLEIRVPNFADSIEWDVNGKWSRISLSNGVDILRERDLEGKLTSQEVVGITRSDFLYNDANFIERIEREENDSFFEYDSLGRLKKASGFWGEKEWNLSPDGNPAGAEGHRLQTWDGSQLVFDASGYLREYKGETFEYDNIGHLTRWSSKDQTVENVFGYEGDLAIRKNGDNVRYIFENQEVAEGMLIKWVFVAGERIAKVSSSFR